MMKRFCLVALALCAILSAQQPSPAAPDGTRFKIAGTLVDAVTGAPLSHATVTLAPVMKRDDMRTVVTANGGQFLFEDLAKGKYALSAQRRGYISQAFDQHDQYSTSISVGPDLDSSSLLFKLRPESSILGRITDDYGDPVANAQVRLFQISVPNGRQGVGLQRRLVTNDEGLYRFSHLPPGDYYLAVSARPWYAEGNHILTRVQSKALQPVPEDDSALDMAFPITFFPGVTEWNAARAIPLGASGSFTADIILQPVRAAHVHINTGDLDPARGLTTTITQTIAGEMTMDISPIVSISSKNEIELTGFAPGNYKLGLSITGASELGQKVLNRFSRLLDASANDEVSVEQSVPAVSVTGSVKLESGSLPASGSLQLREKRTGEAVYAAISQQGEFEFSQGVLPGTYDLVVTNLPDVLIRDIGAAGAKVTGQTVSIGSPAKLTVTLTQGAAKVDGVAQRDGKPVSGAMIVLVPQDPASNPGLFRRAQSDSDGSFTLDLVLPGKYTALAFENGWEMEWSNPEVLKPFLPGGEAVQIEAKGKYDLKLKVQ